MVKFEKLERDGFVAVIVAPSFGAGWSTWADLDHREAMTMDKEIAELVLEGDWDTLKELMANKYPDEYLGGMKDLQVRWVPKGARFEISEYDGSEDIRIFNENDGYVA